MGVKMPAWVIVFGLACFAGTLGRMGGATGYNTKFRDLGVPLCLTIALLVLRVDCPWWALLCAFGLCFGSCTTYLDTIFGYDNLWASGALVGLSAFPVVLFTGHWLLFAARMVFLALSWGALNKYLPNFKGRDVVEEFSRYFLVVASAGMV